MDTRPEIVKGQTVHSGDDTNTTGTDPSLAIKSARFLISAKSEDILVIFPLFFNHNAAGHFYEHYNLIYLVQVAKYRNVFLQMNKIMLDYVLIIK